LDGKKTNLTILNVIINKKIKLFAMKKLIIILAISTTFFGCVKNGDASFATTTGAGGSMARFTVLGNYLYTVSDKYLNVFDVSIGNKPMFIKKVWVGFGIETIYPFKDKLFIGSTSAVYIFSVADPTNPVAISQAISPQLLRRCDPVVAKDSVAYATLRSTGNCGGNLSILAVYNIVDITKPRQVNFIEMSEPMGLGYVNSTLYVCDAVKGLQVFDITNNYKPVLIKTLSDASYIDVVPYNNELICYTKNGLLIYDILDANNPIKIKEIF
jgi:hypothetical protein